LHVKESFRSDPTAYAKPFMNPYGVDLEMFPAVQRPDSDKEFTLLFVGSWTLQKGCDLLVSAIVQIPGVRLIHVGSIGSDLVFPKDDPRFVHLDPVPQTELARFYAEADAFVLASRQDGFGVVLAQALASGLPVICTDRTGGTDLAHTPALAQRITATPHDNVPELVAAVERLRARHNAGERLAPLADSDRETLSWAAYGRRYAEQIAADFGQRAVAPSINMYETDSHLRSA
jgi:glycosyltransferase involved in cell wall biosynthesis